MTDKPTVQPTESDSSFQVIDLDQTRQRVGADDSVLAAIAAALIEECPQRLGEIQQSLQQQHADGVIRGAHTLKGAAKVFSARAVSELAEEIEMAARSGQLQEVPELLERLQAQADRMLADLQRLTTA